MQGLPPAIMLMGPTACGKTELAVALVESLPLEIVSVDSAMVYRGMDIGTAKPDAGILRRAPHRLIDFLDPAQPYSAARFREDALGAMADITRQGRIPLLVGGTMLYFRALLHGLAPLPGADDQVRTQLLDEARRSGWAALHARLRGIDPAAAARIHPNDPQRLQRALEVYELTGTPLSEWQAAQAAQPLAYRPIKLGLIPAERSWLHERIARRFRHMLECALVEEVRRLWQRGDLHPDLPAIRAVGYRQVWAYLQGELSYEQMVDRGIIATRQLAKRQMTWLRSEPGLWSFDCQNSDLTGEVLKALAAEHINSV